MTSFFTRLIQKIPTIKGPGIILPLLRSPFLLLWLVQMVVFFPAVNSELFWDDAILFKTNFLTEAPHPLVYWMDGRFYKTWPTTFSIFKILHFVFAEQYWLYKFANLILHIANSWILLTLLRLFLSPSKSLFIALLFSIHPMQVETVLWIFQMNNLLSSFFFLCSIWFFIEYDKRRAIAFYVLSLSAFFLSVTSKSLMIFLPLLLLFYLVKKKEKWRLIILHTLPFLALSCYYGFVAYQGVYSYSMEESYRMQVMESSPPLRTSGPLVEIETQDGPVPIPFWDDIWGLIKVKKAFILWKGLSFYLTKALVPFPLMFMYPQKYFHWTFSLPLLGFLFLLIRLRKKNPVLDYFFFFWLLTYLPTSGLVYYSYLKFSFVANRFMYLGLVGIMGVLVSCLTLKRRTGVIGGGLLVISFALFSHYYADIFTHPTNVYEHNYKHNPSNSYPLILSSYKSLTSGRRDQAIANLKRVIQNPNPLFFYSFIYVVKVIYGYQKERWILISEWYQNSGEKQNALSQLEEALILYPHSREIKKRINLLRRQ